MELLRQALDIGGKRLRPWRRFGCGAQIGDERLAIGGVNPIHIGIADAARIEIPSDVRQLQREAEVYMLAALVQPTQNAREAAQGEIPPLEDAGEIARDQSPLDIGDNLRLNAGFGLATEEPHRRPAGLRGTPV
jgi:hypothetical protein